MNVLIALLTFVLILVSLFLILVVLMQKTKDGGMGTALGGGATESAFGADTGNVLTKATINAAIVFFVLSFILYLGQLYTVKHAGTAGGSLPTPAAVAGPAVAAPVLTSAAGNTTAPTVSLPLTVTPAASTSAPAPEATATPPAAKPADAPKAP